MIRIHFWGTRGSITSPGIHTRHFGGNTSCVQLIGFDDHFPDAANNFDNPQLILDGGSGLALLQDVLMTGPCGRGEGVLHILLTHYHWDHLIGLPFFAPLFVPGNRITFYGDSVAKLKASIKRLFTSVYSPVKGVQNIAATLSYQPLPPDGSQIAGFEVYTVPTSHPGTARALRLHYGQHCVVYTPDHEAGNPMFDEPLITFARGANIWILDAHCQEREKTRLQAWGHSSHLDAVKLALAAVVETLALFHHAPTHDDQTRTRMEQEAAAAAAGRMTVLMSRDGMIFDLKS